MSDLETEPRPSRRLWVLAAAAALALHLGCGALAIAHLREAESEDTPRQQCDRGRHRIRVGAPGCDRLPAGPDTDASVASPALAEQQAEVKETELPKDIPTEPDEADRLVTPNETNKPKEEDTKISTVQTQASTEFVASEATATPSSEAIPKYRVRRRPRSAAARARGGRA